MGSVQSYTMHDAVNILRHNDRTIINSSNPDIHSELSLYNVDLTPDHNGLSPYEYLKHRLDEVFHFNRKNLNVLSGWIFTCPKELTKLSDQYAFFEATSTFLTNKYGLANVVQVSCHFDEGKRKPLKNPFTGEPELNPDGTPKTELIVGSPHMHFNFVPCIKNTKSNKDKYLYRLNSKECLSRFSLKTIHGELQDYINKHTNLKCKVSTGATKKQGRNYTVEEYKHITELEMEVERLREIERKYNLEHEHSHEFNF